MRFFQLTYIPGWMTQIMTYFVAGLCLARNECMFSALALEVSSLHLNVYSRSCRPLIHTNSDGARVGTTSVTPRT